MSEQDSFNAIASLSLVNKYLTQFFDPKEYQHSDREFFGKREMSYVTKLDENGIPTN